MPLRAEDCRLGTRHEENRGPYPRGEITKLEPFYHGQFPLILRLNTSQPKRLAWLREYRGSIPLLAGLTYDTPNSYHLSPWASTVIREWSVMVGAKLTGTMSVNIRRPLREQHGPWSPLGLAVSYPVHRLHLRIKPIYCTSGATRGSRESLLQPEMAVLASRSPSNYPTTTISCTSSSGKVRNLAGRPKMTGERFAY